MFKYLIKGFFGLLVFLGLLQFLIVPGVVWNILLPLTLILVLAVFYRNRHGFTDKHIKACTLIIGVILLCELVFSIQSRFNIAYPIDKMELKVMTYNLFFKNKSPNKVVGQIRNNNPDVLFVQELTPDWSKVMTMS